ncbi:PFU-domain-containing protein [Zalerion maritima]|uniref:PFU-domain-containing protein n=1 Tax=Zalerion maritima TaxID=339359 RepID=A0AAD5RFM1_9PEZI|nr:PFU-domain-containing protein [Zalerion maritima]
MDDFRLSAQLIAHTSDVKVVKFPSAGVVISGSRDNMALIWKRISDNPPVFEPHMAVQSTNWVNALALLPPTPPKHPDGLLLSGGEATMIDVRSPTSISTDPPFKTLTGHTGNVCTIDVAPSAEWFVSGGWDGQVVIWSAAKLTPIRSIQDERKQGNPAWAVLAFDETTVIVGWGNGSVQVFNLNAGGPEGQLQPVSTIQTGGAVRSLCKLPRGHPSEAHFASAGNDGVVSLWKLNGTKVGSSQLGQRKLDFIYSIALLPTGELVSSGEDCSIRIWSKWEKTEKGVKLYCTQQIDMPARSIWSVAVCSESGDIVAGSNDHYVRIYTRNAEQLADAETLKSFDDAVVVFAEKAKNKEKEKLPGPEFLAEKSGTKDEQIVRIGDPNGSISIHQWSMSQQQWIHVGEEVGQAGDNSEGQPKVEYQGKMYDYVFDVDVQEGQPPLKLPYNLSDNPYQSAANFIKDNEQPASYLDQVANFIFRNTPALRPTQSEASGGADPYGMGSRYMPGQTSSASQQQKIPQKEYIQIPATSHDPIMNKIMSLNAGYKASGRKDISLSPGEEATVRSLLEPLKSGTAVEDAFALSLIIRSLGCWPYPDRVALLGLLHSLAQSPAMAGYLDDDRGSIVDIAIQAAVGDAEGTPKENLVMLALRIAVNVFDTEDGRLVAANAVDGVTKTLEFALGISVSGGAVSSSNVNLLRAASTVGINYAVLLLREGEDSGISPDLAQRLGIVLTRLATNKADGESVFRALVGLGTLMKADKTVTSGVRNAAHAAIGNVGESRVKEVGNEVLAMLP